MVSSRRCGGALDSLGERAQLLASLDRVADRAQQVQREKASGQVSLFGDSGDFGDAVEVQLASRVQPADDRVRLAWEREFLGIYLSDHPLRRVEGEMHVRTDTRCIEVTSELEGFEVRVGGVVKEVRRRPDRSGRTMAFLVLEDLTGSVSVTVFGRLYEQVAELLVPDNIVLVRGKVDNRRRAGADAADLEIAGVLADQMWAFEEADPEGWSRHQVVHITVAGGMLRGALMDLDGVLSGHLGSDGVVLHIDDSDRSWEMDLPRRKVSHSAELMEAVENLLGAGSYRVEVMRRKAPERKPWIARSSGAPSPSLEPEPEPEPEPVPAPAPAPAPVA